MVTLAFWFAVHLEDLTLAQYLLNKENFIKQLVACALINRKGENFDSSEDDLDDEDENNNQGPEEQWGGKNRMNSDDSFESVEISDEDQKEGGESDDSFGDGFKEEP